MVRITVTEPAKPERRRRTLDPITVSEIAAGSLQEGQELDFKREVNLDKPEAKIPLLDDVVAFLNRGPARIIVGVEEKGGRFESFRPISGDPDETALRLQTVIQDGITAVPLDVQVVPIHLEEGFILDIQIPRHAGAPFMNRLYGGYLIRSGARNLPIDPGMLRSRFVDETAWMSRLEELTASEDAKLAASGRVVARQALRIGILPQEHFDHQRRAFEHGDHVRYPGPVFHEHSDPWFKAAEDGHELFARDLRSQGIERLFIRDDWFVHAQAAFAIQQLSGEGIAALNETGNELASHLAIAMMPFSSAGTYGKFFQGEVSFELQAQLTVFELSDLSSREELRSVVLTAIMFMSQQMMRKVDRSIPKALLLDEAWQMLRGGAMADFIETYARTCRKYGASLVTATQSLNDYYKSAGSIAALENSDWFVILQQKPETIADFKKHDRFEMDDYTDALLRSLKRNGFEYSDIMIKGPETLAVGRLVLDPFSAALCLSVALVVGFFAQFHAALGRAAPCFAAALLAAAALYTWRYRGSSTCPTLSRTARASRASCSKQCRTCCYASRFRPRGTITRRGASVNARGSRSPGGQGGITAASRTRHYTSASSAYATRA